MQERAGKEIGWVGRCTASDCNYNQEMKCRAPGIDVEFHRDHADCNTYSNNSAQHEQAPKGRTIGG